MINIMSLGICKLKTRYHTIYLLEWQKSKMLNKNVEEELSFIADRNAKFPTRKFWHFWKKSLAISYSTRHTLIILFFSINTLILLYLPKWVKTYVYTKICITMFIAALFMVVKTWKQSKCPSAGEWINKQVHPDYGILFSLKRNELLLSERSQSEKVT